MLGVAKHHTVTTTLSIMTLGITTFCKTIKKCRKHLLQIIQSDAYAQCRTGATTISRVTLGITPLCIRVKETKHLTLHITK
jgi:hypothetical protein